MDFSNVVVRNELLVAEDASDHLWNSVVMDESRKDHLLRAVALGLTLRARLPFHVTALHGLAVLSGPPGTGKTTLARGLAAKLAPMSSARSARLIEINPHGLMSAEHGRSQQQVSNLLSDYVPGLAADRTPTVLLLDEVESMAVARSEASLSANPADVHRATDAVLTALDSNADAHPHIFVVATTNFPSALDEAFLSRADIHIEMPLPGAVAISEILRSTLLGFSAAYPPVGELADDPRLAEVASVMEGRDGRSIRKAVSEAMLVRVDTVLDPGLLSIEDLLVAGGRR